MLSLSTPFLNENIASQVIGDAPDSALGILSA